MTAEKGPEGIMKERIDRARTRFDRASSFLTNSTIPEVQASALRVQEMRRNNELAVLFGEAGVGNAQSTFQLIERATLGINPPPVKIIHPVGDANMAYLPAVFVNMQSIDHIDMSGPDTEMAINADARSLASDLVVTNELAASFGDRTYAGRLSPIAEQGLAYQAQYLNSIGEPIQQRNDPRTAHDAPSQKRLIERKIGTASFLTDTGLSDVQHAAATILADISNTIGPLGNFDIPLIEQRLRTLSLNTIELQIEEVTEEEVADHLLVLRARFQPMAARQLILTLGGMDMAIYSAATEQQKQSAEQNGLAGARQLGADTRADLGANSIILGFIAPLRK